ncbi:hypothetical protein L6R50_22065 [Myxococcota bacterium]|nr:hypothetical protein [Myxococcota bacterium]
MVPKGGRARRAAARAAACAGLLAAGCLGEIPEAAPGVGGLLQRPLGADPAAVAALRARVGWAPRVERFYVLRPVTVARWGVRREWIWVSVVLWDERGVLGTVASDPVRVDLRAGHTVLDPVPDAEIATYALARGGQVVEGGFPTEDGPR